MNCCHSQVRSLVSLASLLLLLLPAAAQTPAFVTNGLVAFYPLDGDASDASGNQNNGNAIDVSFQTNRHGFPNAAGRFNGQSSSVKVPIKTDFNLLPVTATAWIAFDENRGTDFGIVSIYPTASANGWGIFANADKIRSWYYGPEGSVPEQWLISTNLSRDRWYHAATVFDSTGGRLYLDGILIASHGWSGTPSVSTSEQGLILGEMLSPDGSHVNFTGAIDDVRVYNRALSNEEIKDLYQFDNSGVRRATAEATVINGFVVGITVLDGGFGFTEPPAVEIVGNGTGGTAVATLVGGRVTAITVIDAGSGYTEAVTVRIAPPPKLPTLSIAVQSVRVTVNLWAGGRYLVESSSDLEAWTKQLEFVAEADIVTQDFVVAESGQYFRVTEVR